MHNLNLVLALSAFTFFSTASAECSLQTEVRNTYDYYEPFLGALRLRMYGEIDGLKLAGVSVRAINSDGEERQYPVEIPHWIEPLEDQTFDVSAGVQLFELEARYQAECKGIVYRQQFQDELTSEKLDRFEIEWAGRGFGVLYSCFTPSSDKTIFIK